jgi:glycosyltransferase involved in cell wall biosynthesis
LRVFTEKVIIAMIPEGQNAPTAPQFDGQRSTLLLLGPQESPIGGGKATFGVFLDEFTRRPSLRIRVVNTSPPPDHYRNKKTLLNSETLSRSLYVLRNYAKEIKGSDVVLLFANNHFVFALGPLLVSLARIYRKPFFIKPIGGDLDLDYAKLPRVVRKVVLKTLNGSSGVLAQTRCLQKALQGFGVANVHYVPNCRRVLDQSGATSRSVEPGALRLVFLSQIKREKGVLVLLEALRLLTDDGRLRVSCDLYGPVFDEVGEEFSEQLEGTPNARYCGVVELGSAHEVIAQYDAFVLPTYYASEGHPGVIVEAMFAGVPVISTQHRAIPELIVHGRNGLLVPTRDSRGLRDAIVEIALDPARRESMGRESHIAAQGFRAHAVVSEALRILFPVLPSGG